MSLVRIRNSTLERISCPYCQIGYAMFEVTENGGAKSVDLNQVKPCNACHDNFRVVVQVTLRGAGLDYRHKKPTIERADASRVPALECVK